VIHEEAERDQQMSYDVDALRREEFPWADAGETIYLNNASTGPLPQRTVTALADWSRLRANPERIGHELQFATLARGRELIASLIGADRSEIALATNTSFGINLAAFSLPLKAGDIVLSPDLEFPANVYPWMQLATRRGVQFRQLECADGVLDPARLARELEDERVRAVTVSWVQYASGARVDLGALGTLCRERGVFFVVDAIQGLGPLTIDLRRTPVDIFACGAQKWLLSPWGSAFVYVRRELVTQLEPHDVSWLAVQGSDDFSRLTDYDLTWRDDARRFELITLPYQDFGGMNASLELIRSLGAANVSAHALRLADRIVEWACSRDDVDVVTPAAPDRRAAIVSVRPRDAIAASQRLRAARIAHSVREGAIRLSPHFYNTIDEIERMLAVLAG
jgi:selenocysteine lyase/cysteine desulfurase